MLLAMIRNETILKLTNATLSNLLSHYGICSRKWTSKNGKIRQLLKLEIVSRDISKEEVDKLEKKMAEIEERRKRKAKTEENQAEDEEEAEAYAH